MGTNSTPANAGVSVRRARRADLAPVFSLIQRARGGQLSQQDIVKKATGYAYLIAELQARMIGVAGMLVENSVACVRDLTVASPAVRGLATLALLDAVEEEAGMLACEAVIVELPTGSSVVEALLRSRRYERRALNDLKGFWREVAVEQFQPDTPLWVNSLRDNRK